ncbi:class I SAM-dependent rRNA methyltransferase [Bifidobacterium callitrichos]|uniref:SAM-dependent methyltransferase n=1 Tax=Bifidobacterium callitrichos DSM 23973 TaxID=1437609 RepID=A0A087A777_9BIFI|nr:class I SAM-dependent rRNA methyltransferase [Bifidobacterium callitrichos]KFI54627.1 SAM-dependent methyltransferase [Bifidobacterium callitrichos DSM 23973]
MKTNRAYPRAVITEKGARALESGHPWVYEGEIRRFALPSGEAWDNNGSLKPGAREALDANASGNTSGTAETEGDSGTTRPKRNDFRERRRRKELLNAPRTEDEIIPLDALPDGSIVDVVNLKGTYLGTGLLSRHSRIRVRLVTRNANDDFSPAFWERKIRWAWEYRKTVMGDDDITACRVIFSEADEFPGLIVDRFNDVLVTQTLSAGMERLKPVIFPALLRVFTEDGVLLRGIYERNDVSTRALEGLEQTTGWWSASDTSDFAPTVTDITENGVRYHVDFANGQKTGFFLDQKYNRRAVARLARGRRVLDCCTHTGSFALNAARGGAQFVRAVDVSETAIDMARENARLNGPDVSGRMDFTVANIFDLLPELERTHNPERFDFIILDPPAFTKSRSTIGSAARGYREINYRAMRILPRGGYLATCSCSHFMDHEHFKRMLTEAARDAGVRLRQIEERQQAPDHPIVWGIPETDYLKCLLFQVV